MRAGTLLGIPYQVQPVWLLVVAIAVVTLVSAIGGSAVEALPSAGVLLVSGLALTFFVGVHPVVDDERTLGIIFTSSLRGPLRRSRPDRLAGEAIIPLERLRMRHRLAQARGDSASLGERG